MNPSIEAQRRRRRAIKDTVRRIKESKPCMDCGNPYPYYVMHFDHRDADKKTKEVARLASEQSLTKVLAEIVKCDLVCANCHAERTFQRLGIVAETVQALL